MISIDNACQWEAADPGIHGPGLQHSFPSTTGTTRYDPPRGECTVKGLCTPVWPQKTKTTVILTTGRAVGVLAACCAAFRVCSSAREWRCCRGPTLGPI